MVISELRSCLEYQQNVLGLPPIDAQAYCGELTPGDTTAPVPGGGTCDNLVSCFLADLPYSVQQAPVVLEDSLQSAGEIVGGAIGGTVRAATGGSVQTLLLLALGLGAVYLLVRVT